MKDWLHGNRKNVYSCISVCQVTVRKICSTDHLESNESIEASFVMLTASEADAVPQFPSLVRAEPSPACEESWSPSWKNRDKDKLRDVFDTKYKQTFFAFSLFFQKVTGRHYFDTLFIDPWVLFSCTFIEGSVKKHAWENGKEGLLLAPKQVQAGLFLPSN